MGCGCDASERFVSCDAVGRTIGWVAPELWRGIKGEGGEITIYQAGATGETPPPVLVQEMPVLLRPCPPKWIVDLSARGLKTRGQNTLRPEGEQRVGRIFTSYGGGREPQNVDWRSHGGAQPGMGARSGAVQAAVRRGMAVWGARYTRCLPVGGFKYSLI